jgi:hypothetical protein
MGTKASHGTLFTGFGPAKQLAQITEAIYGNDECDDKERGR